jgi:hypothetical protein
VLAAKRVQRVQRRRSRAEEEGEESLFADDPEDIGEYEEDDWLVNDEEEDPDALRKAMAELAEMTKKMREGQLKNTF